MAWLGEELPANEQTMRTPFAPRCLKDLVEERLFGELSVVFMDTTSLVLTGQGASTWASMAIPRITAAISPR